MEYKLMQGSKIMKESSTGQTATALTPRDRAGLAPVLTRSLVPDAFLSCSGDWELTHCVCTAARLSALCANSLSRV